MERGPFGNIDLKPFIRQFVFTHCASFKKYNKNAKQNEDILLNPKI